MPNWTTAPPDDLGRSGYRLLRTPAGRPLMGYVLSNNLTGCNTHYVGNRTVPCEYPKCDPCANGIGWRWHGYLAIVVAATQEVALFECTAKSSAAFSDYYERYGTTRGCMFKAERLNAKTNGRVVIQAKPADLAKINLPPSPNVEQCLAHIWNLPPNQVETLDHKPRVPFDHVTLDRTKPELPLNNPAQETSAAAFCAATAAAANGRKPKA